MVTSSTNQGLTQVYGAQGTPIPGVFQPPVITTRDPLTTDYNFKVGRQWINKTTPSVWFLGAKASGSATWIAAGSGSLGAINTLTGGSGGALSPTAGNMNLLGTASQITSTGSGSTITFSIPAAFVAPGSIASTTTLTSGTSLAVTTSATVGTTLGVTGATTLAALTQIGTTLINASGAAVTTIGTGGTGAVNLGNATGNTAVTGSLTASTTLTATLGNITATNGNFVSSASGKGILLNSPTTSGVASGPVVVNGRSGAAVFTTVSIAAAADLTLTITNSSITGSSTQVIYCLSGVTTGAALSIKSVTNTAGSSAVVITNGTGATTTTADITLTFLVLN